MSDKKIRGFKVVSRIKEDIKLPQRNDEGSAGYDFYAIEDIDIYPIFPISNFISNANSCIITPIIDFKNYEGIDCKDIKSKHYTLVKTGIKAYMPKDEYLALYIRSSLAMKHGLSLVNNCGIVDASYYNNESNEGEIGFLIINFSTITYHIKKGDKIGQGIFHKYYTIDNDIIVNSNRIGGFGSSGV